MTKRYREALDRVEVAAEGAPAAYGPDRAGLKGDRAAGDRAAGDRAAAEGVPTAFTWRGKEYRVLQVLGHWREDPGWWRGNDGQVVQVEQTDLWRVEARNGAPTRGIYEIVRRGESWRLEKVWD